jgi:hypothetical protein
MPLSIRYTMANNSANPVAQSRVERSVTSSAPVAIIRGCSLRYK